MSWPPRASVPGQVLLQVLDGPPQLALRQYGRGLIGWLRLVFGDLGGGYEDAAAASPSDKKEGLGLVLLPDEARARPKPSTLAASAV